ncbi:MAG: hypothetical protein J6B31_07915 [Bacteroidaceae bacterium]|nr:hypothetical protein [Bacteroidaceae bacterium]
MQKQEFLQVFLLIFQALKQRIAGVQGDFDFLFSKEKNAFQTPFYPSEKTLWRKSVNTKERFPVLQRVFGGVAKPFYKAHFTTKKRNRT